MLKYTLYSFLQIIKTVYTIKFEIFKIYNFRLKYFLSLWSWVLVMLHLMTFECIAEVCLNDAKNAVVHNPTKFILFTSTMFYFLKKNFAVKIR